MNVGGPGIGRICVSIAAPHGTALLAAAAPIIDLVDVVEIRLDALVDPDIGACIAALAKPVLVTNRPIWEGGQWQGSEEGRIALLEQCLLWGAHWVDIELRTEPELLQRVRRLAHQRDAQLIVSSHDFKATPDSGQLHGLVESIRQAGADIGKIVTTAASSLDALRVLHLQEQAAESGLPLIAFAMGKLGAITRLSTLYLGGYMTYVALSREQATAPGQLTLREMHGLIERLTEAT
ncbi:MAG: type I 3-dehydroquinate dehydratase [Desulfobulbus sp.]|jgi:3-dehydroquinate dehydratase-1